MANNVVYMQNNSTQILKDFDAAIQPELLALTGGTFRQYCNHRNIKGATRVLTIGSGGNYTSKTPYLVGKTGANTKGYGGSTRTIEVAPEPLYSWETLTWEQIMELDGRITNETFFVKDLANALNIGEDIKIVEALERADALMPATNKVGDSSKPIYEKKNMELFKKLMVVANSKFKGKRLVAPYGAWCLIHNLDWASIMLRNGNGAIFASSDFVHMTGVTGLTVTTVCGVAMEIVDDLDKGYGDTNRTYYVQPGTIRFCLRENIISCSWEDSVTSSSQYNMADGDRFIFTCKKSFGARVKDPNGVWKFSCKSEALNVTTDVDAGSSKENPIYVESKAATE